MTTLVVIDGDEINLQREDGDRFRLRVREPHLKLKASAFMTREQLYDLYLEISMLLQASTTPPNYREMPPYRPLPLQSSSADIAKPPTDSRWLSEQANVVGHIHDAVLVDDKKETMPSTNTTNMRRFQLHRDKDASGVSGVGVVAEGCEFTNGACALTWLTKFRSVAMYTSVKELEMVHGHEGATRLVWIDS